jgi:hypothetical protein
MTTKKYKRRQVEDDYLANLNPMTEQQRKSIDQKDALMFFLVGCLIGMIIIVGAVYYQGVDKYNTLNSTIPNETIKGYWLGVQDVAVSNTYFLMGRNNLTYIIPVDGNRTEWLSVSKYDLNQSWCGR